MKVESDSRSLLDLFADLQTVVAAEREAIESLDIDLLPRCGDQVESLFKTIIRRYRESPPQAGDLEKIGELFNQVRQQRAENSRLLNDQMEKTGLLLDRNRDGRKVLNAYFGQSGQDELFVRKNC